MTHKWLYGIHLTEKAADATTLSVNQKRRFRDNGIFSKIFNEILYYIWIRPSSRAKLTNHKKAMARVERTLKPYPEELNRLLSKIARNWTKPFDR